MASKLNRTVSELLATISRAELDSWVQYYSEPREDELTHLYLAQLTTLMSNINGGKTDIKDFIFDFSKKPKAKTVDRRTAMRKKLREKYGRR